MKKNINFRCDAVHLLWIGGSSAFTIATMLALTGCGGGSGNSIANAPSGGGKGSVTIRVPFASSDIASNARLQAVFPSSVNHVEIELFGAGVIPEVIVADRAHSTVTFSDKPVGEKWLLFLAINDSSTVLIPNQTFTSVQRTLSQGSLTTSRVFSTAALRIDVAPGGNTIDTVTIGSLFSKQLVFGQPRTVGNFTGLELTEADNSGDEHRLVVSDSTGAIDVGRLNTAQGNAFVLTNVPGAMIIPTPLENGFVGDFTKNSVNASGTTPIETCHREIVLVGIESLGLPGVTTNAFHLRSTDTCTPASGGSARTEVVDTWFRTVTSAGASTSAPIGPVLRTKRQVSSSNTVGNRFSADEVAILVNASAGSSPLNGVLGSELKVGPGTFWGFISARLAPGTSQVGAGAAAQLVNH